MIRSTSAAAATSRSQARSAQVRIALIVGVFVFIAWPTYLMVYLRAERHIQPAPTPPSPPGVTNTHGRININQDLLDEEFAARRAARLERHEASFVVPRKTEAERDLVRDAWLVPHSLSTPSAASAAASTSIGTSIRSTMMSRIKLESSDSSNWKLLSAARDTSVDHDNDHDRDRLKHKRVCVLAMAMLGSERASGLMTTTVALVRALSDARVTVLIGGDTPSMIDDKLAVEQLLAMPHVELEHLPHPYEAPRPLIATLGQQISFDMMEWLNEQQQQQQPFDVVVAFDWMGLAYYPLLARRLGLLGSSDTRFIVVGLVSTMWWHIDQALVRGAFSSCCHRTSC